MYFKNGYYIKGNYFNKFLSSMLFPCKVEEDILFLFFILFIQNICVRVCVDSCGKLYLHPPPFPSKSIVFLTTTIIIN